MEERKAVREELRQRQADYIAAREDEDRALVEAFEPRLFAGYDLIAEASGSESKDPFYRAADLIRWLERIKPASIHEIGSGRSSLIFSVWAARNDIPHSAFEQRQEWVDIVERAIDRVGGWGQITCQPVTRVGDTGMRFVPDIPEHIDFVYLDGPSAKGESFTTPNGRPIFYDVPDYLSKGVRPRLVLVDGRFTTCGHLLAMGEVKADYEVQHQFRPKPEHAGGEFHRHTALLRR